jgi:hypothetical protein
MWLARAPRVSLQGRSFHAGRIRLGSIAILALTIVVGAAPAYCGDAPVSEDGDWEPVNQVLEIPQACTRDGVVISCDQGASNTGQVPEQSAASGADNSGGTETASTGGSHGDGDYNVPEISPDWGSVEDYENQEIEEAPIYAGVPAGGYAWRPPSYAAPNLAPVMPRLTPAWTRPPFGSGPWMIPPSATMMGSAPAPLSIVRPPFPLH